MIKFVALATGLLAATVSLQARAQVAGESFDVLASVMETTRKEVDAQDILASNKDEAIKYREKITAGWWEFMQANSKAGPGEYCVATFLRAKRVKREREDGISDGMMVSLFGPGGNYRGALLGFSPLTRDHGFPKLKSGNPVLVTLKQGTEKAATLNAIYTEVSPTAPPMLLFAVPNIEALMGGMKDDSSFEVIYQGKSIANIEWHDGLKARTQLKQCLVGKRFDNEIQ